MMESKMKTIQVNIRFLEKQYHIELKQFENGETYKMFDLMNAIAFRMPKLKIGGTR